MPDVIGDNVDRLVSVEMRNRGLNYNIVSGIYGEARREGGGRPLSTRIAEALIEKVKPGDSVFIVTGAGYAPESPNGEIDGPPGAAALARALFWGLQAVPVYVTERCHAPPVVASSQALGIMVRDFELAKQRRMGACMENAPVEQSAVASWAAEIFDKHKPAAIIAIERLGPNEQGLLHYSTGVVPKNWVDVSPLFDEAHKRGVLSIGIGDNGNEIGFGRIHPFMKKFHPYGSRTQYEGGTGVPSVTSTDILFAASISNWAAYGVVAMLAYFLQKLDLIQTAELEKRMIWACLDAGGWEMRYLTSRFIVDGTEGESSMAIIQLLRDMVRINISTPDRGLAHGKING
ncbi:hypothetical protein CAL12_21100 [Bordetella genomosp. 8]|uniref:D-glutamate cyclase-like C-terminal domain-containing protein n=1 Tax=Bordetella genomosp. 8 TaxID=1416806 RepID=A0A1W6YPX5_9BORD|nr:glutamate cyclase domain-containing protein [Bordetella genomosp. 8]ARP83068.1 hypothetical protein CAL12_21100 [Bordetella genomosp. 8]